MLLIFPTFLTRESGVSPAEFPDRDFPETGGGAPDEASRPDLLLRQSRFFKAAAVLSFTASGPATSLKMSSKFFTGCISGRARLFPGGFDVLAADGDA